MGELEISNDPDLYAVASNAIYKLYNIISDLSFTQRVLVKFETDNETIEGYFSRNDCKFDHDRKTITVTPAIFDIYTDFLENWEEEVDFADYPLTTVAVDIEIPTDEIDTKSDWYGTNKGSVTMLEEDFNPTYDTSVALATYFNVDGSPKRTLINVVGGAFTDNNGLYLEDREEIRESDAPYYDYELSSLTIWVGQYYKPFWGKAVRTLICTTKFSRDEEITADVSGTPVSPSGSGWTMRGWALIDGQDGHLWTRKPFNGVFSNDWTLEAEEENSGGSPSFYWEKRRTTNLNYTFSSNSKTVDSSIHLKEALAFLYNRTLTPVSEDAEYSGVFTTNNNACNIETHSIPVTEGASDYNETQTVAVNTTTPLFGASLENRINDNALRIQMVLSADAHALAQRPNLGFQIYLRVRDSGGTAMQSIKVFDESANVKDFTFTNLVIDETINVYATQTVQLESRITDFGAGETANYTLAEITISSTQNVYQEKSIISTFLFNDLDDIAPISFYEDKNYVTNDSNYLNNTRIMFTRDILEVLGSGNTENVPTISFKDFYDDLNKLFKGMLTWDIMDDGDANDGNLRIEHIRYIDLTFDETDISTDTLLEFTNNWNYDKSEMFNRIELSQVNAGYEDFTDNLITFDSIVSNNRNKDIKKELRTSKISTDLKYAIESSTDLTNGIILIATDSTPTKVLNKEGIISGKTEVNGYMAYSNLLFDFGKYEGVWESGVMNSESVYFKFTKRNKLGQELIFKGLEDKILYKTQIGIGLVDSGEKDFENETTTLKLRYRYNSSEDGDTKILIVSEDEYYDFANYET